MRDMMEYKGYFGSVHYSDEDEIFYGKAEYIRSLISYEGTEAHTLKDAFREGVDDYLVTCESNDMEPEKPFKGSFNVRVGSEVHREAMVFAKAHGLNLNQLTKLALRKYIGD